NQNRLLRNLESVERGTVATVRHVNSHADFIHALDDGDAEIGDTVVASFSRTIADQIARVVSELRNALAEAAKEINIVRTPEVFRILPAENDPDLARLLDSLQVGRAVDAHEGIAVVRDKTVPRSKELECAVV